MAMHAQQRTLDLLGGLNAPSCQNRGLRFSRFTDPTLKEAARHEFLDVAIQQKCPRDVIDAIRNAHRVFIESIPDAILLHAKNQGRLLLNMAGGVLENAGISLERFSGLPRIPGSAVKGAARRAAIQSLRDTPQDEKAVLLANIALTFGWVSDNWRTKLSGKQRLADGTQAPEEDFFYACRENFAIVKNTAQALIMQALDLPDDAKFPPEFGGLVAFFDALPSGAPRGPDLELDIVTSHHPDYYGGKMDVALDTESPNPVVFPAIAAGHTFTFAIAPCLQTRFMPHEHRCTLRDLARAWLIEALTVLGIGAKTAAGYGWFEDETDAVNGAERQAAEKKAAQEKAAEDARKMKEATARKQQAKEDFDSLSVVAKLAATADTDVGQFKRTLEKFASFAIDDQKGVVAWFASEDGQQHWAKVISGKKPFKESVWKQVEQVIRKVRKDHNLEKLS